MIMERVVWKENLHVIFEGLTQSFLLIDLVP